MDRRSSSRFRASFQLTVTEAADSVKRQPAKAPRTQNVHKIGFHRPSGKTNTKTIDNYYEWSAAVQRWLVVPRRFNSIDRQRKEQKHRQGRNRTEEDKIAPVRL